MAATTVEDKDGSYRIVVPEDSMRVQLEWLAKERSPQASAPILSALQECGIVEGLHLRRVGDEHRPRGPVQPAARHGLHEIERARFPGRWDDVTTDAGAVWAIVRKALAGHKVPIAEDTPES